MTRTRTTGLVLFASLAALALVACGGGSSDPDVAATYVELTGAPDPSAVLDTLDVSFAYPNNLTNGIWHQNSNQILVGYYSAAGYWSHPADANGWPGSPDHDTGGTNYLRMVYCARTNTVVYGTSVIGDPEGVGPIVAADLRIASIDRFTGVLGVGVAPTFSDGYTGNCTVISASATELLILEDATTVRRYTTTDGSTALQAAGIVTLSQALPAGAVADSGNTYGGTFAFDGAYFYFATVPTSSASLDYAVYAADGTFVASYTAAGSGSINSIYFDWSVGRYTTHDGYGGRSAPTQYVGLGGGVDDDTQCYGPVSAAHTLKP